MQIEVFTEGSGTTRDPSEVRSYINLFEGGFLSVKTLCQATEEYGEVQLHILSDEYGYIRGDESPEPNIVSPTHTIEDFTDALFSAARNADAIVVLLTSETFREVVATHWDSLVSESKGVEIWCIGASKTALSDIDLSALEERGGEIILYNRVGVARIGNDEQERFIDALAAKASRINSE